ncbi:MAG: class I SAM-dependent methyltransferase [Lachnospiraceae bacterium]|nr:class I SAM-dependent methyltransferase [Lachnospiraceae bacterium]
MESYTDFAEVYDEFMDATPYRVWCERLSKIIDTYGISKKSNEADRTGLSEEELALTSERDLILDLGCGTGTLTELMAEAGYDMMGIDMSYDMLQIAMEKQEESGHDIMYLCQDMRELELYCTVGTVICVCDSINYVLEDEEVIETFKRVNNYLFPKGLFIFDFNTDYKYREVIGDTTIAENREDCSFIWENFYDEESRINEYDLTVFVKEDGDMEEEEQFFRRFQETHFQRGYDLQEMLRFAAEAGLEFVCAMDADTEGEVTEVTERVLMVCREKGKKYE